MNFYWESFKTFFKIGAFTLGGGYAMIPIIESEIVEKRKWINKNEFLDLIAIAQSCPGVFAVNISVFIGYKLRRLKGALCMAAGASLPSFLIILLIAIFFQTFKDNVYVEKIFMGIRPCVVALILTPCISMARKAKLNKKNWWLPVATALLIACVGISPIFCILAGGIGGYLYGQFVHK